MAKGLPEIKRSVVAIGVRVSSFSLAVLLPNSLSLMEVIKLNMKDFLNSRRFCFGRERYYCLLLAIFW